MFRKLTQNDSQSKSRYTISGHSKESSKGLIVQTSQNQRQYACRVPSFSSFLSEVPTSRSELQGFRRIAKACSKTIGLWSEATLINSRASMEEIELEVARQIKTAGHDNRKYDLKGLFDKRLDDELAKLKEVSIDDLKRNSNSTLDGSKLKKLDHSHFKRVVVLTNIPPNSGINSILSQVCGGPLEKVIYNSTSDISSVELYFIFPDHARRFHNYGSMSGMFIVNGWRLQSEWATQKNTENGSDALISKSVLNDVLHGARRTLILAKVIPKKVNRSEKRMFYPDPVLHFSKDFQALDIRLDFLEFGEILEISPVISKRLCFCIHFADVRSAVKAKHECETDGTTMFLKYCDWTAWYGKDIADKLCPSV